MTQAGPVNTLSEDERRILERYVRDRVGAARPVERVIPRRAAGTHAPLSFEQELIFIHSRLAPELPLYNEILTVRRSGPLDVPALERTLTELVRRHEAWRTTFEEIDGQVVQVVQPPPQLSLPVTDLSALPEDEREREALRLAMEEVRRPLDVRQGPLVRFRLVRMTHEEHRLYVIVHLIVHDGVSVYSVFLPELVTLYEAFAAGTPSPLPEPGIQYSDYAAWQRDLWSEKAAFTSLEYWRKHLAGGPPPLELPTDGVRPAVQSFRGDQHTFTLRGSLTSALKRLSQREGVTLFATLLSAFKVLLHRYSGQEDIAIGTAISTRRNTEVERLLGVFLNRIVVRTTIAESQSFREVLSGVQRAVIEGLSHGDVPFHVLVKELSPKRDPGRNPLSQVTFVMEPPMPAPRPGWNMTQMDAATGVTKVDLYLQMDDRPEGLVGHVVYSTDLWEPATIVRMMEHFELLLEGIATDPGLSIAAIPILTPSDRLVNQPDPDEPCPESSFVRFEATALDSSIAARFAEQVAKHPRRIALRDDRSTWTYAALNQAANRVAHALVKSWVVPGDRVALLLDHDATMVAGILGILKCGAAYVPLDPTHPEERLRLTVADAFAAAVVTNRRNRALARELLTGSLPILEVEDLLTASRAPEYAGAVSPEQVAYLLYTSGSTGKPKGIAQSHRNVLHFIAAYTNRLHLSPEDRLAQLASHAVDAGVMDTFGALLNGAALHLIDVRDAGLSGVRDRLARDEITVYHSTPTLYRQIVRDYSGSQAPRTIRLVVLGGEETHPTDVTAFREIFAPHCMLVNGFGLTESSVSLQYFVNERTDLRRRSVPVGRPVERTIVTLLSKEGRPNQVYGEIAIKSPHVALGYWQDPDLTKAVFVPDPAAGKGILYKTGDMGRLLPDGNIEYHGRRDLQVKVHGFRVELGDIETALGQHPGVREVAATVRESPDGEKRLVAHFVPRERAASHDELRRFLRRRLPAHMVPAAFVQHDQLPLTPTGKVDRRSLPVPDMESERGGPEPNDDVERRLTAIWTRALGAGQVGVRDDFFALGGHSLLALRMMADIHRELGINLPLSTLFEAPTVERLAEVVRSRIQLVPPRYDAQRHEAGFTRLARWLRGG